MCAKRRSDDDADRRLAIEQAREDVLFEQIPRGCTPEVAALTIVAAQWANIARLAPAQIAHHRLRLARDDPPFQRWLASATPGSGRHRR
jgi:hypothetical protein